MSGLNLPAATVTAEGVAYRLAQVIASEHVKYVGPGTDLIRLAGELGIEKLLWDALEAQDRQAAS